MQLHPSWKPLWTDKLPRTPEPAGKHQPAIRFRVRSEAPHASKEKALADALMVARLKLAEQLVICKSSASFPNDRLGPLEKIRRDDGLKSRIPANPHFGRIDNALLF